MTSASQQGQQAFCPNCRGGNPPGATVCQWCRYSLSSSSTPTQAFSQVPSSNPQTQNYTSSASQPQVIQQQSGGGSCFGVGLLVTGVLLVILVQGLALFILFGGARLNSTFFQDTSVSLLGILITLGIFAVFLLPGAVMVIAGKRR